MKNFTYYQPKTVDQAVGLLDSKWGPAELLAGGTDLLDLQKEYIAQPDKVISLSGITALAGITFGEKSISIGARTTLAEIADNAKLRSYLPALATAAGAVGGPQLQNMGTLGGNLCQRNRCWYFRDEHVLCLLKGGQKCFATDGDNRYHAVFTSGQRCVIVSPSTLAPVLVAVGAKAEVQGKAGRTVELAKFFQAPAGPAEREHVLAPNEVLTSVTIPYNVPGLRNASYEVRHKQSYDWPLVQAAVAFTLAGGKATNVKVVLGHVAPTPHVAEGAAKALEGQAVSEATAAAAGKAATLGAKPLSQNAYKLRLIEVAVKRAVLAAGGQKPYWEL